MNDLLINFVASMLLGPGPILPTANDFSGWTTQPVEQHVTVPAPLPGIENILALPSGFRLAGYGGLTMARKASRVGGDTRFDLTDPTQWPVREDEILPTSSSPFAGN
jgi:hypothetical protein